jgi:uncharacterized membrane protein YczE
MLVVPTRSELRRRLPRLLPGLVLCGVGLGLMVQAGLGLGPWEVLHQGIARRAGVPIGTVTIVLGFFVLLGWIPLRQRLGVGTLINVVAIGLVINATIGATSEAHAAWLRWACMLAGVALVGVGSGLYIGAGLGAGPRDGLMTGVAGKRGRSIRSVRTVIELSVLVVGWAMGGTVGAGTLVFAFGIGPLVQHFLGWLTLTAPAE